MANIKLTNSVKIDYSSIHGMACVNPNNYLCSNQYDWTATQDCFLQLDGGTNTSADQALNIAGKQVIASTFLAANKNAGLWPVKKGDRCIIHKGDNRPASDVSRFRCIAIK